MLSENRKQKKRHSAPISGYPGHAHSFTAIPGFTARPSLTQRLRRAKTQPNSNVTSRVVEPHHRVQSLAANAYIPYRNVTLQQ